MQKMDDGKTVVRLNDEQAADDILRFWNSFYSFLEKYLPRKFNIQ